MTHSAKSVGLKSMLLLVGLLFGCDLHAQELGFTAIFNGKDLTGWEGDDKSWAVVDGAIHSTGGNSKKNWLIWRGGELSDFELRLSFKFTKGNSGVQVRSKEIDKWQVRGYQVEIANASKMGLWHHSLAPEKHRSHLATAGQRVRIGRDGKRAVEQRAPPAEVQSICRDNDWNELVVTAVGPRLVQEVNGVVFSELIDEEATHAERSGLLALQDHGKGCVAAFKNIRIKHLRSGAERSGADPAKPNILLILVDDMGYGDPQCFNPESRLKTPAIDRLAREGLMFRDAHAPDSTCCPSRYGLLTGRYPVRGHYRNISPKRLTLPELLGRNGYNTGMVGKWHVGFDNFKGKKGGTAKQSMTGGPVDRGFDEFFGLWGPLDGPPYFYMKNRTPVEMPTEDGAGKNFWSADRFYNGNWLPGKIAPNFKHVEVTPRLTAEAIKYINKSANKDKPFFLYFALPSPHGPWVPTEEFKGSSPIGVYGDFAQQVDHSIGQVLEALDDNGIADNTLVIFTSDNGPVWYQRDRLKYGHSSASIYSGMKGDVWEGGHRMPFVVRWPALVKPGLVSDSMIGFTDIMATFAEIVGDDFPEAATTDSLSFFPVMKGETRYQVRETLIVNAKAQAFRHHNWKLITRKGPGGFTHWEGNPKEEPDGQLYDLEKDPSEKSNLWDKMPEKVNQLQRILEKEMTYEK